MCSKRLLMVYSRDHLGHKVGLWASYREEESNIHLRPLEILEYAW